MLFLLAGGGRDSDWVANLIADPEVLVEVDGRVRRARGRIVESDAEAERARSLVFDKYASRYNGDLTSWRQRALPVAVELDAE